MIYEYGYIPTDTISNLLTKFKHALQRHAQNHSGHQEASSQQERTAAQREWRGTSGSTGSGGYQRVQVKQHKRRQKVDLTKYI